MQPSTASQQPPPAQDGGYARNWHAARLFDGIASGYDLLAELLSGFQYGRWRRALVSRMTAGPDDTVIDVCTGTAGVAMAVARAKGARVAGVDLSPHMLAAARSKVAGSEVKDRVELALGRAEDLPLADGSADVVCFTFLLRYINNPAAIIGELVRVLRPGGQLISLEFAVPENPLLRGLWKLYAGSIMPPLTLFLSPGWRYVGAFLSPSITRFYAAYSVEDIVRLWREAGVADVRIHRLSFGSGVMMWGTKAEGT